MKIERFEDLEIWKEARELCKVVYSLTSTGSFQKNFRFRDQILASSGSIMDNIAEGFERNGRKEFIQFLSIAKGSCGETRSQLYRAFDQLHISKEVLDNTKAQTEALSKKIGKLIQYLKKSTNPGSKF